MAEGIILSTVGTGLVKLLNQYGGFSEGDIVLKSPVDAGAAKLSLFLYQVQENPYLKNREMEAIQETGLRPVPLVLDLYYLVTPLSQEPDTALKYLENVMRTFHDYAVMKGPDLSPTLVDAGNKAIRIVSHYLSLEEINQLWGVFPNKAYQLSVAYIVTPIEIPSTRTVPVTRVVEKVTKFSRLKGAS